MRWPGIHHTIIPLLYLVIGSRNLIDHRALAATPVGEEFRSVSIMYSSAWVGGSLGFLARECFGVVGADRGGLILLVTGWLLALVATVMAQHANVIAVGSLITYPLMMWWAVDRHLRLTRAGS